MSTNEKESHVQYLRKKFEALASASTGWFYNQRTSTPSPPPLPKSPPPPPLQLSLPSTPNDSSESFESCSTLNHSSSNPRWSSDDNEIHLTDNRTFFSEGTDTSSVIEENDLRHIIEENIDDDFEKATIDTTDEICETKNLVEFPDEDADDDEFYDSFDETSDEDKIILSSVLSVLSVGKISNIVEELMYTEEDYIKTLKAGIDNYITIMDAEKLPRPLKGHKYTIFCTIEKIYDFHHNELLPKFKKCNNEVDKICEVMREMIRINRFYLYVLYGMNKPRSQMLAKQNQDFFKDRQNEIGDKLGLNSFLMQPIQRIFKYSLLLCTIIGELTKHYTKEQEFRDKLAICCKAEKDIKRLLDATNEAITINDIEYDEQSYDINLCHQGKFLKGSDFDISDPKYKTKKFKGRLFIFERLLVYTEYNSNEKLSCRGSFKRDNFGIRIDGKKRFYLSSTMHRGEEVGFIGPMADEVIHFINGILIKVATEEKEKINRQISIHLVDRQTAKQQQQQQTNNVNTTERDSIGLSLKSNRTSLSSHDSYEISNTTWDERKTFEKMRNSEKYYIHMIMTNMKLWINNLHPDIKRDFDDFSSLLLSIHDFHNTTFYPELIECCSDYQAVINLFKTHLNNDSFCMYIVYSSVATQISNELQKYHITPTSVSTVSVQDFIRLPIKRIADYMSMIDVLVKEVQTKNLESDIFKEATILQTKFNNFHKIIDENYKLYSIQQTMVDLSKFGNVIYSDLVSIDFFSTLNHRIFIMDNGIICVKVRESSKTKMEKYIEIVSNVLYTTQLSIRGSKKHQKRVEFDTAIVKSIIFGVTFRSLEKRQLFCERLLELI